MSNTDSDNDIERGVYQTPSNDDDLYDDYDDEEGFGRGPVFAIFAVISLASVVGLVWLAFQMGVSQGRTSAPPIISASADPFKVEPDEPGGMAEPEATPTTNALAGQPIDEVAAVSPSAETPIEVPRTTAPSTEVAANDAPITTPQLRTSNTEVGASGGLVVPPPSDRVRNAETNDDLRNPPDRQTQQTAALEMTPRQPVVQPTRQPDPEPVVVQPTRQPTPQPTADPGPVGPPALGTVGPSLVSNTGNFVVQVASFPETADADAAWARLQSRHASIVGGHVQDVQSVDLGARGTWYRLRIGYFETRGAATSLCEQLQANNQDCLVASR